MLLLFSNKSSCWRTLASSTIHCLLLMCFSWNTASDCYQHLASFDPARPALNQSIYQPNWPHGNTLRKKHHAVAFVTNHAGYPIASSCHNASKKEMWSPAGCAFDPYKPGTWVRNLKSHVNSAFEGKAHKRAETRKARTELCCCTWINSEGSCSYKTLLRKLNGEWRNCAKHERNWGSSCVSGDGSVCHELGWHLVRVTWL